MAIQEGTLLSRFRIVAQLGSGGMGEVYLAEDTLLRRKVALKLLPLEFSRDAARVDRFHREAELLAALNHPNVVILHSLEELDGTFFLVTEYIEGKTLDQLIPENGLPPGKILDIAIPITEGLSAAHSAGIIHRDLKPSNVMVTEAGRVKILDFGLAVAERPSAPKPISEADTSPTGMGEFGGTLAYMSPEQLQGDPMTAASDIFSFGVLLFEMSTGKKPFSGQNAAQIIAAILRDDPPSVRKSHAHLPEHLAWIIRRCLQKKPEDRPRSMVEVGNELADLHRVRFRNGDDRPSIAVMPFRDVSRERDQEYFCEGISEELIHALGGSRGIRVLSRAASFKYANTTMDLQEVGKNLNVDAVLSGSVRKAGDRLRISAELISVEDSSTLWSDRYEREFKDIFAVQDEISGNIAKALARSLFADTDAPARRFTPDLQAYDLYLRGRKFYDQFDRKGIEFALQMFARAIELDPAYARAYCGMADCCCYLFANVGKLPRDLDKADAASRKALELAPDLAEAHTSRAVALSLSGNSEEAESEFETAIRLDPELFEARYFYARHCFAVGKLEKAVRMFEQASVARPDDYQSPLLMAQVYEDLGLPVEAAAVRRKGIDIAEAHLQLSPDDVRALYMGANGLVALGERIRGLEWAERARKLEPSEPMVLYNLACIYSLADEFDRALECLEEAVRNGFTYREWMEHDSNLAPVRSHERFVAVLRSMGNN